MEALMMDVEVFYKEIRTALFHGKLSQTQVNGMNSIINFWENPPVKPKGKFKTNWDIRSIGWLAYMLATTFHETSFTMQPITEYGSTAYLRRYCNRKDLGNGPANGGKKDDGPRFRGRGYVQLTGRKNYSEMTPIVQTFYPDCPDLTEKPDAVKKDEYAAVIMFYGMFMGSFTGMALKNFIGDPNKGQTVDFYHARRIINGLDKAEQIESYAKQFNQALEKAGATA